MGTVMKGSTADLGHGKPIVCIGHRVHCPEYKGTLPIMRAAEAQATKGQVSTAD